MPSTGASKSRARTGASAKKAAPAAPSLPVLGLGLFLVSAASLAFEVTLTHLYSLVLQYHFAFLAISSAILGLGIGAALGYRLLKPEPGQLSAWLSRPALIFALAMPAAVLLFNWTGIAFGLVWEALLGVLPYVVVGLLTAQIYTACSEKAAWLYAFDLGGAAVGLLGVQLLLNVFSAASAVFLLGLLAALGALVFAWPLRRRLTPVLVSLGIIAVGLVLNLTTHFIDLPYAASDNIPPDKTMFAVLNSTTDPGRLVDSAWSAFARVDLVSTASPDQMYVFTNAGAGSYMFKFNGDLSQVKDLSGQLEFIPFMSFIPRKTLILGAGAGKDVLQALLAGSQDITAVEINPAMVALTRKYASYNGSIFDYPGVKTVVADGRSFVEHSADAYDMIYLNLVYAQAPSPGSNALSEAYVFTTQAFQAYWNHLAPGGRLAIVSHQGLEGTRALITAIQALNNAGVSAQEALKHTALLMYNSSDPNQNTTVMILQKTPLTPDQVNLLGSAAPTYGMQPLFLPGVYESLFAGLVSGEIQLDQFLTQKDYNIFPTTDDRPFFFAITPGLPQPLVILLVLSGVAVFLYLLLSLGSKSRPSSWQLLYFGGLGLGYMLVEVPLIQRALLLTGSPTRAMAVVLVTLLVAGGLGSYISSRWKPSGLWVRLSAAAACVTLVALALALWQPALFAWLGRFSPAAAEALAALSLVPAGLLMGVPFANGLRLSGERDAGVLPYLWGWNALTSVLGSALAAVVAMLAGFHSVLLLGAACYAVVCAAAVLQGRKA